MLKRAPALEVGGGCREFRGSVDIIAVRTSKIPPARVSAGNTINLLSMRGCDSGPSLPLRMSTHLTDVQSIPQIVANHHYQLLKQ